MINKLNLYTTKSFGGMKIKDFSNNEVAFYIARKNVVDYHNDKFLPNSIIPNSIIFHYLNHDQNLLIGNPQRIEEDDTGWFAVSKLLGTSLGKDVAIMYAEDAIKQHSIGGYIVDGQWSNNYENYEIKQFKLIEVSSLTMLAAQQDTPVKKDADLLKQFEIEYFKAKQKFKNI